MILPRQYGDDYCYDRYGRVYRCGNSAWYNWGRWVALGAIVLAALLFFYLLSCWSARRRRRAGRTPLYGTGWAGKTPFGHGPATYNPGYPQQNQSQYQTPPQYNQNQYNQNPGGYYGENQSYFGGNQNLEMQPPPNTYRGGDNVYAPPAGPPPAKQ